MQNFPIDLLKEWFLNNRRSLPWREDPSPYRVWISEVMLQQTQVAVVVPYFQRWMAAFPTVQALAEAPLEEVLKCWEGLGYYSRARNLHKAAHMIVERHQGELPSEKEELAQIKGIGPYTQGAIRSFAFRQKAAAVDGNVLRVLSRFLAFEGEIEAPKAQAQLRDFAESILPDNEPWLVSEGLIELGATVCAKKAKCGECPLKRECLAFRHRLQEVLPKRRERPKTIVLKRHVAVVLCEGHFLVTKGETGKVMADLYEFPYLESIEGDLTHSFEKILGIPLTYIRPLGFQQHTFTRYRAQLFPHLLVAASRGEGHIWMGGEAIEKLPFSAGHRKILRSNEDFTY